MSISTPRERWMIVDRVLDHVEVAQAEEVHLQQADLLDRAHRVLGDDLVLALGLAVAAVAVAVGAGRRAAILGELQGDDLLQRPVGDDDRGGVDRVVADDPLEALGDVEDLLRVRLCVVGLPQLLARLEAFLEGGVAAEDRLGDLLGEAVAGAVVEAEHAGGVAGRGARRHLAEGDDLGDRLAAVLLGDVADHALAAAHREVDVDVGHRLAARVEEALEEQVVGERVDVGDRQRVGDDRAGGRATAGADGDAVVLRVADEIPDDQEVGGEAHLLDHAELELEPLLAPRPAPGRRSGRAGPRRRCGAASPPAPRRRASGSAAAAACRARSRHCSARRSPGWSAPPRATRRRRRPFRRSP